MRVGVKYCGGCNPRFDRVQFIEKLKDDVGENIIFEKAEERYTYDFLLIVGGCAQCCAAHDRLKSSYGRACVRNQTDYKEILAQLHATEIAIS